MYKGLLYERFHGEGRVSSRIVNESNFTYINIIKILSKFISKGGLDILDLGCGVGTLSFYMSSKGNSVLGVDVSQKAINTANETKVKLPKKLDIDFEKLNSEHELIKRKFDLILMSEVLEHIPKDMLYLKNITKLLKSKGYLILSVPSLNAPLHKLGLLKKFDKEVGHLRRYDVTTITNKLVKCSLAVRGVYKFEGFLRNLLFTHRNFNFIVRFLKGPFSLLFNFFDNLTVKTFGESQLVFVVQK